MKPTDQTRLGALVRDVHKYYRQDVTPFLYDVWWDACQPFTYEQVSLACSKHVRDPNHGQFCPKAADIVRVLGGTRTDRSVVAWGKAFDAMARVGAYQDVVFWDPVIHVVIQDMGGWPKICRTEEKDLSYVQHRFMELFQSYTERGIESHPRLLAGARDPDEEYARRGLPVPGPVLIGDPEQCQAVYTGGGQSRVQLTFVQAGTGVGDMTFVRLPAPEKKDED